jgi:uncharacterized membrane protein
MFKLSSFFKKFTIEIILGAILLVLLITAIARAMRKRRMEKMTDERANRKRRMENVQKGWNSIRKGIRTMVS